MLGESINSDNKIVDFLEMQYFGFSDYYICVICDIVDGLCCLRLVWCYNKVIFRLVDMFFIL